MTKCRVEGLGSRGLVRFGVFRVCGVLGDPFDFVSRASKVGSGACLRDTK